MGKSWKDKRSSNKWDRQDRRVKNDRAKGSKPAKRSRQPTDDIPDESNPQWQ
jgi:hypothetical protein